ncbi:MAG: hypothetical protein KY475_06715, partial [Planctomycetes bacterium]|nr:hypothetical protein [Planctomycetota bacterium]
KAAGSYTVRFQRGPHFDRTTSAAAARELRDSPFYDQLHTIGFDDTSIRRILAAHKPRMIAEWADITLAARERNGSDFFTTGPEAYFLDNIKHAAKGMRTPPDWWRQMRLEEEKRRREARRDHTPSPAVEQRPSLDATVEVDARNAFEQCMSRIFSDLRERGVPEEEAREQAVRIATMNVGGRFRRRDDAPQRAFDLFGPSAS